MSQNQETYECLAEIYCKVLERIGVELRVRPDDEKRFAEAQIKEKTYIDVLKIISSHME